jgi:TIR domain/Restriction endonuclease
VRILSRVKRPKIFISHASEDLAFVDGLVERLKSDGVDVWLGNTEIRVGDSISERISTGLDQSDFFAIVLSTASSNSGWVRDELASAISIANSRNLKVFILPLLLTDCEVPALLRDRRVANFKEDSQSAYQELLDSIRHHYAEHHPDVDISKLKAGELNEAVVQDVARDPRHLQRLAPRHFEELVAKLLLQAGYRTERAPLVFGGRDIIATRDQVLPGLASDRFRFTCNSYIRPIGLSEIALLTLRDRDDETRLVLVTRTRLTAEAQEAAAKLGIDVIDGETLAQWIRMLLDLRLGMRADGSSNPQM